MRWPIVRPLVPPSLRAEGVSSGTSETRLLGDDPRTVASGTGGHLLSRRYSWAAYVSSAMIALMMISPSRAWVGFKDA